MIPLNHTARGLATTVNLTGFRGVWGKSGRATFYAAIGSGRAQRLLGTFGSALEAAQAYDRAARALYGAEARLNFPGPGEHAVRHADDPTCIRGHALARFGVMTSGRASLACRECWRLGRARLRARARGALP
jgi:hypothetical protein